MNRVLKTALVCFATNFLFVIAIWMKQRPYEVLSIGIFWLLYLLFQLLAVTFLLPNPKRRNVGKGILLGAGISLLIGLGVCSGKNGL